MRSGSPRAAAAIPPAAGARAAPTGAGPRDASGPPGRGGSARLRRPPSTRSEPAQSLPARAGSGSRGARAPRSLERLLLPCPEHATERLRVTPEAVRPAREPERPCRGADEARTGPAVHARTAEMDVEAARPVADDDTHRTRAHGGGANRHASRGRHVRADGGARRRLRGRRGLAGRAGP